MVYVLVSDFVNKRKTFMEKKALLRIACMGGVILDHYHIAQDRRVVGHTQLLGGVAVNIAKTLKKRGSKVHVYSAIGKDNAGSFLKARLQQENIPATLFESEKPSGEVTLVYGKEGALVATSWQTELLDGLNADDALEWGKEIQEHDGWIFDTDLPQEFTENLVTQAPKDMPLFITTVTPEKTQRFPKDLSRFAGVFMNSQELAHVTGFLPQTVQEMQGAAEPFFKRGARVLYVTQGQDGAWCLMPGVSLFEKATLVEKTLVTTHGAGDAFCVGVILHLLQNVKPDYAASLQEGIKSAYIHLKEVNKGKS